MSRKNTAVHSTTLRLAVASALAAAVAAPAGAQEGGASAADEADLRQLTQELAELKSAYAQEVRRLRELDMQVQALQARLAGKVPAVAPGSSLPAATATVAAPVAAAAASVDGDAPSAAAPPSQAGYASTAAEAEAARKDIPRSVADVKQATRTLFDQRLVIENGLTYNRYDRKQLTLNGFLALDAIFLGNIAIENVESDTLNYNLAARWGVTPRLTLNLDVPYVARKTVYQKGGAGGAAGSIAQEETTGSGLGDMTASANFLMLPETPGRPETVLNFAVTAPTGQEPYGIPWIVLERDDDQFIRFAVPEEQPTGNGAWQTSIGVSAVKTSDPAILYGNIGYTYSFESSYDDIDNNPATVNPGDVKLGDSFYFGAGVAFAFNERTSFSMSLSNRLSARTKTRYEGQPWAKVIGSDANSALFNLGVTYALNDHATMVGLLGIGLTPDAPDFTLGFRVPYSL